MKRKMFFGVALGVFLIAFGVLKLLSAFGLELDFNISFDGWWTLFIIVPAIVGLFTEKNKTDKLIVLSIGIYLLLAARDVIDCGAAFKLFLPTVLILIGIKLILNAFVYNDKSGSEKSEPIKTEFKDAESENGCSDEKMKTNRNLT